MFQMREQCGFGAKGSNILSRRRFNAGGNGLHGPRLDVRKRKVSLFGRQSLIGNDQMRPARKIKTKRRINRSALAHASAHDRALFLLRIVERQVMRDRRNAARFMCDGEFNTMRRIRQINPRNRHRLAGERRDHRASDDANGFAIGNELVARCRGF